MTEGTKNQKSAEVLVFKALGVNYTVYHHSELGHAISPVCDAKADHYLQKGPR